MNIIELCRVSVLEEFPGWNLGTGRSVPSSARILLPDSLIDDLLEVIGSVLRLRDKLLEHDSHLSKLSFRFSYHQGQAFALSFLSLLVNFELFANHVNCRSCVRSQRIRGCDRIRIGCISSKLMDVITG